MKSKRWILLIVVMIFMLSLSPAVFAIQPTVGSVQETAKSSEPTVFLSVDNGVSKLITADRNLLMWGNDTWDNIDYRSSSSGGIKDRPYYVDFIRKPVRICGDENNTFAVLEDGSLIVWGYDAEKFLFSGAKRSDWHSYPYKIMDNVRMVKSSYNCVFILTNDNKLFYYGNNYAGILGDKIKEGEWPKGFIKILEEVVDFDYSDYESGTSLAYIKTDSSLWVWGKNNVGQLGTGVREDITKPTKILDNVKSISLNYRHGAAIKKDGTLWTWGCNQYGQLGTGKVTEYYQYKRVKDNDVLKPYQMMTDVKAALTAADHTMIIKNDGTLWSIGISALESIDKSKWSRPQKIMDQVETMATGMNTLVMKKDGSLFGWGANSTGQVGCGKASKEYYEVIRFPTKINYEVVPQIPDSVIRTQWKFYIDDIPDFRYATAYFVFKERTYFDLRDFAAATSDSSMQFGVTTDMKNKTIEILNGESSHEYERKDYSYALRENGKTSVTQAVYTVSIDGKKEKIVCYEADGKVTMEFCDILDLLGGYIVREDKSDGYWYYGRYKIKKEPR